MMRKLMLGIMKRLKRSMINKKLMKKDMNIIVMRKEYIKKKKRMMNI